MLLAKFGKDLYVGGRPYSHYSETINAFNGRFPKMRRLVQPAWDVAFQWLRVEPHVHHQALPWQGLLALVSVNLLWGLASWPFCGGTSRIGEVLRARRADLVLPADLRHTVDYILLAVREPKTRFTAANHQFLKLDQPELVRIVSLAVGRLEPH